MNKEEFANSVLLELYKKPYPEDFGDLFLRMLPSCGIDNFRNTLDELFQQGLLTRKSEPKGHIQGLPHLQTLDLRYGISMAGIHYLQSNHLLPVDVDPLTVEADFAEDIKEKLRSKVDEFDLLIDVVLSKKIINTNKDSLKKYLIDWLAENKDFDLQIKDGDFLVENGDFSVIPKLTDEDVINFIKWFKTKQDKFLNNMKVSGIEVSNRSKNVVKGSNNIIIGYSGNNNINQKKVNDSKEGLLWTKYGVYAAILGVIVSVILFVLSK